MENRKYALYTFLTLMIELSVASLMDMLLSKFESFYSAAIYSAATYVPMSDKLWHYVILKVICVTAALFLYCIIKCYYKGGETHEESDTQKKTE